MKRTVKTVFLILFMMTAMVFGALIYLNHNISDNYYLSGDKEFMTNNRYINCKKYENTDIAVQIGVDDTVRSYSAELSLLGIIPIKKVNVTVSSEDEVVVIGKPFGVTIYTEGAMIVGFVEINTENGIKSPAAEAGLLIGDQVISVNGKYISTNNDVVDEVNKSGGRTVVIVIKRDGKESKVKIDPVRSLPDGNYKIGLWIRDSSAGIGTLTFYSPKLGVVAGLGHGVCDADTEGLVPLESGQFLSADIVGIKKATKEQTGELQGVFSGDQIADFVHNDITGVYGINADKISGDVYKLASKQEAKTGEASIITTLDDGQPQLYSCRIEKIFTGDGSKIKNMTVKITDKRLLEKTGGIVQGMSGSPVIQNGKLIGAITHVLVDDPTTGYAIFAENMLETAQTVASENKLKDAS